MGNKQDGKMGIVRIIRLSKGKKSSLIVALIAKGWKLPISHANMDTSRVGAGGWRRQSGRSRKRICSVIILSIVYRKLTSDSRLSRLIIML